MLTKEELAAIKKKIDDAKPALQKLAADLGEAHALIDNVVALSNEAGLPAPFLEKARVAASDLGAHLGSHLSS